MKKQVIRVGDRVRIVNSLAVRRVGYPLVWYDIVEQVKKDPRTRLAYEILTGQCKEPEKVLPGLEKFGLLKVKEGDLPPYFVQACAKLRVEQERFGGNERTLHYYPWRLGSCSFEDAPDLTGQVHTVDSKRVVKTGARVPETVGTSYSYDGPEEWYESGGLENMKTHVLLKLQGWEFEECNVELVKRKV